MSKGKRSQRPDVELVLRRLRRRIAAAGMTQVQIAALSGFTAGHLSLLLSGREELKVEHLLAILRAVELPPDELFTELSWAFGQSRPAVLTPKAAVVLEKDLAATVGAEVERILAPTVRRRKRRPEGGGSIGRRSPRG